MEMDTKFKTNKLKPSFFIITKDTIAEDSRLHFKRIPAEFLCLECDNRYFPEKDQFTCPICNSTKVKIIKGSEFFLESIDVE